LVNPSQTRTNQRFFELRKKRKKQNKNNGRREGKKGTVVGDQQEGSPTESSSSKKWGWAGQFGTPRYKGTDGQASGDHEPMGTSRLG